MHFPKGLAHAIVLQQCSGLQGSFGRWAVMHCTEDEDKDWKAAARVSKVHNAAVGPSKLRRAVEPNYGCLSPILRCGRRFRLLDVAKVGSEAAL